MKTLVVSLLRLGDIVCATPVLHSLRRAGHEVHLLINDNFRQIVNILPELDGVHFFSRSVLQEEIRDLSAGSWSSVDRVTHLLRDLEDMKFDCVINLTHNRQSAWLMGAIPAPYKLGLEKNHQGEASIHGAWFRFLDERNHLHGTMFHHVDIFKQGVGLDPSPLGLQLREDAQAIAKAESWSRSAGTKRILVQVTTSDPKKNWQFESWADLFRYLTQLRPKTEFLILCSPDEEVLLLPWVEALHAQQLPVRLAVVSLAEVLSLCRRSDLVITVDTSIKHIAAATSTPILEIALGSGNFHELGTYREKSWIVASRAACYPCRHSESCSQPTHLCSQKLPAEMLAVVAHKILDSAHGDLRILAREYADLASLHEVIAIAGVGWWAHDLAEQLDSGFLLSLLEKMAWALMLGKQTEGSLPEYGSYGLRLAEVVQRCFPGLARSEWMKALNAAAYQLEKQAVESSSLTQRLRRTLAQSADLAEALRNILGDLQLRQLQLNEDHRPLDYATTLGQLLGYRGNSDFSHLRRISQEVQDLSGRLEAERRMLHTLTERIMGHEC